MEEEHNTDFCLEDVLQNGSVELTEEEELDSEVEQTIREIFGDDGEGAEEATDFTDPEPPHFPPDTNFEDEYYHLKDRRFVVGEREILHLLRRSTCEVCDGPIIQDSIVEGEHIAAGVKYSFICTNGHKGKWISSPFYGGKSVVALLLQLMVVVSGLSWEKFSLGASFINLATGSSRAFYHRLSYGKSISDFFIRHLQHIHSLLAEQPLSLCVDVRYDSPGFSANKATGVFMDAERRLMVSLDIADSREVDRVSQRLEKHIVNRGLLHLITKSKLLVWEVISDASRSIISLLKTDPFKHLTHSLDIWHKAKKLTLRLSETDLVDLDGNL